MRTRERTQKWAVNAVAYCARSIDDVAMERTSLEGRNLSLKALGEAIRTMRRERGISQEELAHITELDRSHVGRIERGERNVSVINLVRIAEGLEVPASDIMKRAGL